MTTASRAVPAAVTLTEARSRSAQERRVTHFVQGALALDPDQDDDQFFGPQPTSRSWLPDPAVWGGHIAQALLEAMAGVRNPAQLVRWVPPEPYAAVATAASAAVRRRERSPDVRRPRLLVRRDPVETGGRYYRLLPEGRIDDFDDGVAEVSVVLQDGPRIRAMALRLVGQDGRWRVAALRVG